MLGLWLLALAGNLVLWGLFAFFPDTKSFYAAIGLWWYIAALHAASFLLRRRKNTSITLLATIPLVKLLLALGGTLLLIKLGKIRVLPLILTLSSGYVLFGVAEVTLLLRNLRAPYAKNSPAPYPSKPSLE